VTFLNENSDLLVGHQGKISTVKATEYNPFEIPKLYKPSEEDLKLFYM
jgi:hypothetical protein